jgi:hypothetical protein
MSESCQPRKVWFLEGNNPWDVKRGSFVSRYPDFWRNLPSPYSGYRNEDGHSRFVQNISTFIPNYMALHPTMP